MMLSYMLFLAGSDRPIDIFMTDAATSESAGSDNFASTSSTWMRANCDEISSGRSADDSEILARRCNAGDLESQ
jgi:hypothetical protein